MSIKATKLDLNPNMTFEEFEALANREPNLRGSWIYRVTQATYHKDMKYPYPKFELDYPRECYFKTFQSAEKFVKKPKDDVYCSWITQIHCGKSSEYGKYGARWLYDQNGELLDYTITQELFGKPEDFTFFGRPKSRQRFKVGDIVEVVGPKYVRLAVYNAQILDVKRCWKIYKKCQKRNDWPYMLDSSDECALVIEGPYYYCHDHVSPLQLLKPRYPIPDDILADMLTWNKRCENEEESAWLKTRESQSYREERQKEKGEYIGEFYNLEINLHFDKNNIPHLHINDFYGLKVGLRIDRPEYYDHDDYTGRLTSNQVKSLYDYLSSPNLEKTRWWYMLRKWNEDNGNPKQTISLDTPLPNYLELINKSL